MDLGPFRGPIRVFSEFAELQRRLHGVPHAHILRRPLRPPPSFEDGSTKSPLPRSSKHASRCRTPCDDVSSVVGVAKRVEDLAAPPEVIPTSGGPPSSGTPRVPPSNAPPLGACEARQSTHSLSNIRLRAHAQVQRAFNELAIGNSPCQASSLFLVNFPLAPKELRAHPSARHSVLRKSFPVSFFCVSA